MPGATIPASCNNAKDPRLVDLLQRPENKTCADCGESSPRWCSVTLGVVICTECAGIHRKLGTHLSFVQSLTLDKLKDEWLERLSRVGNGVAAHLYEARLPSAWSRPKAKAAGGDRVDAAAATHLERFIRAKYELKLFASHDTQSAEGRALDAFYSSMRRQHASDRQRREMNGNKISTTKRNQEDLYIDDVQRDAAYAASRTFLHAHRDWLEGPKSLAHQSLIARVALQHFFTVDLEDLRLPAEKHRSNNTFNDSFFPDVSEQFLKDSTWSCYRINGEEFNFAAECKSEENLSSSEDFTGRLVVALRTALGTSLSPAVLRAASTVLSQCGMAHLERACTYFSPPVVVSGGEQAVLYELEVSSPGVLDLRLSLRKSGFSQAVVHPKLTDGAEGKPKFFSNCHSASFVEKACSLRFDVNNQGGVLADVILLDELMKVFDANDPADTHSAPVSDQSIGYEAFHVLLRRGDGDGPFGLAPCRSALRRGVLKLRAGVAAGTAAEQWNEERETSMTKLQEGDLIIKINDVIVSREDAGAAALQEMKQQQVFFEVRRLNPSDEKPSYERLVAVSFALFNPVKLDCVSAFIAKQPARTLFFRVCSKYMLNAEDLRDVLHCFWNSTNDDELKKVIARAEQRIKDLKEADMLSLLRAVCRRLVEGERPQAAHLKWPQTEITLKIGDPSAPIGMHYDRAILRERKVLKITDVLPNTPAAATLLCGDVIEFIGESDASDYVLGGGKIAAAADAQGTLKFKVRRASVEVSQSATGNVDTKAAYTNVGTAYPANETTRRYKEPADVKELAATQSSQSTAEVATLREELEEARKAATVVASAKTDHDVFALREELEQARRASANNTIEPTPTYAESELAALKEQLEEARQAAVAAPAPATQAENDLVAVLKTELDEAKQAAATANNAIELAPIHAESELVALKEQLEEARQAEVAALAPPTQAENDLVAVLKTELDEAKQAAASGNSAIAPTPIHAESELVVLKEQLEEARQAAVAASALPTQAENDVVAVLKTELDEAKQAAATATAGAIQDSSIRNTDSELVALKEQLKDARALAAKTMASDAEMAALRAELAEASRFRGEEAAVRAERERLETLVEEASAKKAEFGEQERKLRAMTQDREIRLLEEESEQMRVSDALRQEREALELQRRQMRTMTAEAMRLSSIAQTDVVTSPGVCQELRLDDSDAEDGKTASEGQDSEHDEVDAWDLDWSAVKSDKPSAEVETDTGELGEAETGASEMCL